eukprot:TRINITY_DN14007_c0_g1_i1.p2 TRINITY_DN14007_c0_g1~~TRINITY_DN14007_c0_g1_i1.p2  ORF type:complete len:110 (+),score=14.09 TRINITY_DN14007_c0_g1_i1:60-389(+)
MEKPSRTLFIRNIEYETEESTIRDLFAPYGDIKSIFNLISTRGMAFITFYNLRQAMEAKSGLQDRRVGARFVRISLKLSSRYTVGRSLFASQRRNPSKSQGRSGQEQRK